MTNVIAPNPKSWSERILLMRLLENCGVGDGCWEWNGSKTQGGYPCCVRVPKSWGRNVEGAHRIMYRFFVGDIPEGMQIDHLCKNRACINPSHLEAVSPRENTMRGDTITRRNMEKTHCPSGHPYSGENLYVDRTGRRHCKECRRRNCRIHYARHGRDRSKRQS